MELTFQKSRNDLEKYNTIIYQNEAFDVPVPGGVRTGLRRRRQTLCMAGSSLGRWPDGEMTQGAPAKPHHLSRDPRGGRRKLTSKSCPLTSVWTAWHTHKCGRIHVCMHACIRRTHPHPNKVIKMFKGQEKTTNGPQAPTHSSPSLMGSHCHETVLLILLNSTRRGGVHSRTHPNDLDSRMKDTHRVLFLIYPKQLKHFHTSL